MKRIEDFKTRVNELIQLADLVLSKTRNSDFYTFVETESFATFRSASLSFLKNIYGEEHPYYADFSEKCKQTYLRDAQVGRGILISVKHEIDNGWLFSFKSLITSEIFSDFLEMSKYLLDENYKDPSAVMIGSILEEHLRQLCIKNSIPIETKKDTKLYPKKADLMNAELATKSIYNKLEQKNVTSWLDLRNKAAHGKYSDYTLVQVELMYQGVLDFITRNTI